MSTMAMAHQSLLGGSASQADVWVGHAGTTGARVSMVNGRTQAVTDYGTGANAVGPIANAAFTRLYYALSGGNVGYYDIAANTFNTLSSANGYLYDGGLLIDGDNLYCLSFTSNVLVKVNHTTNTYIGTATVGSNFNSLAHDATHIYTPGYSPSGQKKIAKSDLSITSLSHWARNGGRSSAIHPTNGRLHVGDIDGALNYVTSYNVSTGVAVNSWAFSVAVYGIVFTPLGTKGYALLRDSGQVRSFDPATSDTYINTISVGGTPSGASMNASGTLLYITNGTSLIVIDTGTDAILSTTAVPTAPLGVAVMP